MTEHSSSVLTPLGLPDPAILWESERPALQALQHEARRRLKSPWALLSAAITQSLLSIPYPVRYRSSLVPEGTPLNLAIALVGRSGAGKSTVFRGAAAAIVFDGTSLPDADTSRSGEGIPALLAHIQAERGTEPRLCWRRPDRALWVHWDEVGQLGAQSARTGSTVLESIKSLTSGEQLGGQNSKGDGLTIPPATYRALVTIAVQPRRAAPLLSEEAIAGGLAARFLWFNFEDADAATLPRPTHSTDPVTVSRNQWDGVGHVDALPEMDAAHEADARAALAGIREPIDSRVQLNRAIIAIALANLDGRSTLVPEDWLLAGAVIAHSLDTLEHVRDALSQPDDAEHAQETAIANRMVARMEKLRCDGIPFDQARRRLSRPQGDALTALLNEGRYSRW